MKTLIRFNVGTTFITLLVGLFYSGAINACDIQYQGGGCYSGETEWYQGKERPHGYGDMWTKDWSYHGMYSNGEFDGKGTLEFQSGQKYRGEWYDGKKQGQGTYWWPSGQKYEGEWKDDNQQGKGTIHYKSGNKFVGIFKNDSEWNGTYYSKTGAITGKETNGTGSSSSLTFALVLFLIYGLAVLLRCRYLILTKYDVLPIREMNRVLRKKNLFR